jgi:hypothetical protein
MYAFKYEQREYQTEGEHIFHLKQKIKNNQNAYDIDYNGIRLSKSGRVWFFASGKGEYEIILGHSIL